MTAPAIKVGDLVAVDWNDATFTLDDTAESDADHFGVTTVGWLIRRSRATVWIASERLPSGAWRGVTRIPRRIVTAMRVLA